MRYLKEKGKERPEIPGCKEKIDMDFIKFVLKWDKKEGIENTLKKNPEKEVLIFKNRRELNKWYTKKFKQKICVHFK